MLNDVRISAVIPAFNREKTIVRAIESVLAQESPTLEILVVDDGSEDETARAVAAYGSRVRIVRQANAGVSGARNRGVKEANYEWIAFLDSDDYWLPGHLTRMVEAIRATKGEAAVYFADMSATTEGFTWEYWKMSGFRPRAPFEFRDDAGDWITMRVQPMMFQASVINRRLYLNSGGLPSSLRTREDTLMFFKLGLLYPMCAVTGIGTKMTSDADHRLTKDISFWTVNYCAASIFVATASLSLARLVRSSRQQFYERELSRTHFSMAQAAYRDGLYHESLRSLFLCGIYSPIVLAKSTLGTFKRRFEGSWRSHNRSVTQDVVRTDREQI